MMIDVLKAITEENRLKIVKALNKGAMCVCDIEKELKLPQNLVSHHLSVLKEANLVENCRCGKKNYYSIDKKAINKLVEELKKLGE